MEMRKVALENMELQRIAAGLKTKATTDANAKAKSDAEARASMVKLAEASKEKKREWKNSFVSGATFGMVLYIRLRYSA